MDQNDLRRARDHLAVAQTVLECTDEASVLRTRIQAMEAELDPTSGRWHGDVAGAYTKLQAIACELAELWKIPPSTAVGLNPLKQDRRARRPPGVADAIDSVYKALSILRMNVPPEARSVFNPV